MEIICSALTSLQKDKGKDSPNSKMCSETLLKIYSGSMHDSFNWILNITLEFFIEIVCKRNSSVGIFFEVLDHKSFLFRVGGRCLGGGREGAHFVSSLSHH